MGRSVLITSSDNEANDILDDPKGVFTNYFYLNSVSKLASGIAGEDINLQSEIPDAIKKAKDLIIIGSEKTVTDKLIELIIDKVGPFGTLLLTGHDVGEQKKLWENSFSTMSNKIKPILSDYIKQKFC